MVHSIQSSTTINTTTDVPKTLHFWDSVASVYASNPMTKTENDDELRSILENIKHMP